MLSYENAKKIADEDDNKIIEVLQAGLHFRVEAGAGAGKTYSLNKVVNWLDRNKQKELEISNKKIACITYTNTAVEVIKTRIQANSRITPMTIHSFAWENIRQFNKTLISLVNQLDMFPKETDEAKKKSIQYVQYTVGVKYVSDGILYLYHDDVIKLFSELLDNVKFRRILASHYAVILIDEYQDSFSSIMDRFLKYFIDADSKENPKETTSLNFPQKNGNRIQFGFFGDGWQTIYASSGACGEIDNDNIAVIKKRANFRSQDIIVKMLNRMRPDLVQVTASDEKDGMVMVITTQDYKGVRLTNSHYKNEMQPDDLRKTVNSVLCHLIDDYRWKKENTKVLMLTHKNLANQQNYSGLLEILGNHLKDADDPTLCFFRDTLEPVYKALDEKKIRDLYNALKVNKVPVYSKKEKAAWKILYDTLKEARTRTIGDVLDCAIESRLLPIAENVRNMYVSYLKDDTIIYARSNGKEWTAREFYSRSYSEMIAALAYLSPDSIFSTDHGVKGEEYDNVLFVVGRGWNNYKFDEQVYKNSEQLTGKELDTYKRNRNLFYVCCSRPRKNLVLLITVPINDNFMGYLKRVFGSEDGSNILTYSQFIDNRKKLTKLEEVQGYLSESGSVLMPINTEVIEAFADFMNQNQRKKIRAIAIGEFVEGIVDLLLRSKIELELTKEQRYEDLVFAKKVQILSNCYDRTIAEQLESVFDSSRKCVEFGNSIDDENLQSILQTSKHIVENIFVQYFLSKNHKFGSEDIYTIFSMLPLNNRIYILEQVAGNYLNRPLVDRLSLAYVKNGEYEKCSSLIGLAQEDRIITENEAYNFIEKYKTFVHHQDTIYQLNKNYDYNTSEVKGIFDRGNIVVGFPPNKNIFEVKRAVTIFKSWFDEKKSKYQEFVSLFFYLLAFDDRSIV